jgi:dUTP pyrophosphatase
MTIQLKLAAAHFSMQPEDVLLTDSRLALLADVQDVVTIAPMSHARIPTPISFAGDGNTIALIDMHCGKLSHALDKHDGPTVGRGEYFIPPIGELVQVDVDVINETNAIIMIRPGMRIGLLDFININNEAAEPTVLQDENTILAEFNPVHVNPADRPRYAHDAANGTDLKADIPADLRIAPGTTVSIPTGLTIAVPAGLDAQARSDPTLPEGIVVQRLRAAAIGERRQISVAVSNLGLETVTIRPGDLIAQLTFTPVIRATLQFASADEAALPASAIAAQ